MQILFCLNGKNRKITTPTMGQMWAHLQIQNAQKQV